MAIKYKKNKALFRDLVSVEEAEALLEWLQKTKHAIIDFTEASHIHTAVIQVLLAGDITVAAWSKSPQLQQWLKHVFENKI